MTSSIGGYRIDKRVALPTLYMLLVQTVVIAFGGGMIYSAVVWRIGVNEAAIVQLRERVAVLESDRIATVGQLSALKTQMDSVKEDLGDIKRILLSQPDRRPRETGEGSLR